VQKLRRDSDLPTTLNYCVHSDLDAGHQAVSFGTEIQEICSFKEDSFQNRPTNFANFDAPNEVAGFRAMVASDCGSACSAPPARGFCYRTTIESAQTPLARGHRADPSPHSRKKSKRDEKIELPRFIQQLAQVLWICGRRTKRLEVDGGQE
jgi:hypothetical protein